MPQDPVPIEKIRKEIFSAPDTRVYAVLDGASIDGLLLSLDDHDSECICLYRGNLPQDVEEAAPYLVSLEEDTPFTRWLLDEGWGNHWGIFAVTGPETGFRTMCRHFRSFITVKDPDGRHLYFRFYDPRVLRAYLPSCNREEAGTIFGPILHFILEGEASDVLLKLRRGEADKAAVEIQPVFF